MYEKTIENRTVLPRLAGTGPPPPQPGSGLCAGPGPAGADRPGSLRSAHRQQPRGRAIRPAGRMGLGDPARSHPRRRRLCSACARLLDAGAQGTAGGGDLGDPRSAAPGALHRRPASVRHRRRTRRGHRPGPRPRLPDRAGPARSPRHPVRRRCRMGEGRWARTRGRFLRRSLDLRRRRRLRSPVHRRSPRIAGCQGRHDRLPVTGPCR